MHIHFQGDRASVSHIEEDEGQPAPKFRLREWRDLYPAVTGTTVMVNRSLVACKVVA